VGGDGVVAVDKERCLQGQAGDGEVWVIALEYTPELVEAGGVSCDTTPLDTEGVVIGVETDIIHLTVANNWTNTDGGVFLRHVHPSIS